MIHGVSKALDERLTWSLYKEMRRPVSAIETKLHLKQRHPVLTVDVESHEMQGHGKHSDLKVRDASRDACTNSPKDQKLNIGDGHCRISTQIINGSTLHEPKEILYEFHSCEKPGCIPYAGSNDKFFKKLVWDKMRMKYVAERELSHQVDPRNTDAMRAGSDYLQRRGKSADHCSLFKTDDNLGATRRRPHTAIQLNQRTPLNIEQAELKNKIIYSTALQPGPTAENLNVTEPVKFQYSFKKNWLNKSEIPEAKCQTKNYTVQTGIRSVAGMAGREKPITSLSISERNVSSLVTEPLSYEDLLYMKAPITTSCLTMSYNEGSNQTEEQQTQPHDEMSDEGNDVTKVKFRLSRDKVTNRDNIKNTPTSDICNTHVEDAISTSRQKATPMGISITRQCSMPSYAIIQGSVGNKPSSAKQNTQSTQPENKNTSMAFIVDRSIKNAKRNKNQTKPQYIPPSARQHGKSVPSISRQGQQGVKKFLSFTLSVGSLIEKKAAFKTSRRARSKSAPSVETQKEDGKLNRHVKDVTKHVRSARQLSIDHRVETETIQQEVSKVRTSTTVTNQHSLALARDSAMLQKSGHFKLNINLPLIEDMSSSNVSSRIIESSIDEESSRSQNLEDVDEDNNRTPTPQPEPTKEDISTMRNRIHQELLKTLSEADVLVKTVEERRKNRKPQIIYSDDEDNDILSQHKMETVDAANAVTTSLELEKQLGDQTYHCNPSEKDESEHSVYTQDDLLSNSELNFSD